MKNILMASAASLLLSACMQDARAPVNYKEGVFYGRDASYDRGGNELPKYNNYNRAKLPPEQDGKYVNDSQHQYGVSAAVDKVESVELPPPEPVNSSDLPAPVSPSIANATEPAPFVATPLVEESKTSLMPEFEKNAVNPADKTTLNWQKTKDNAQSEYDDKILQAEAKLAAQEQESKLQQQADRELVTTNVDSALLPKMVDSPVNNPNKVANIPTVTPPAQSAAIDMAKPNLNAEKFVWPLKGKLLKDYNNDVNKGILIAGRTGEPVRASASGVVVHVGEKVKSFGNMIIIQHPDGYVTTYSHLSDITVSENDNVVGGQLIGFVGKTGDATQPQLHFAVRHNTQAIDPAKKLAK